MPAYVQLEHLQGGPPPTAVPVSAVRFRDDDTSGVDTGSPILPPADVRAQLMGPITGANTNTTTANILPVTPLQFTFNDYAIIDAGTSNQEVIRVLDYEPSSTNPAWFTITACFQRNHAPGSILAKCKASFSKTIRFHVLSAPANSITNIRFFRTAPLPYGVYDQFRIDSAYAPADDTPWTSDIGKSFYPVPTTYPVLLLANPVRQIGPLDNNLVEIQWLYVARLQTVAGTMGATSNMLLDQGSNAGCQAAGMSDTGSMGAAPTVNQQVVSQLQVQPSNYHWRWDES
jgi:hypothetical protein